MSIVPFQIKHDKLLRKEFHFIKSRASYYEALNGCDCECLFRVPLAINCSPESNERARCDSSKQTKMGAPRR